MKYEPVKLTTVGKINSVVSILFIILFFIVLFSGCSEKDEPDQNITIDIKPSKILEVRQQDRVENWIHRGSGSCVNAEVVGGLILSNCPNKAEWWRNTYGGGRWKELTDSELEKAGIKYASTEGHDFAFIQRCLKNRLTVSVDYPRSHCQKVVGYLNGRVYLIDNNGRRSHNVGYKEFRSKWGGWAFTIAESPPPPF